MIESWTLVFSIAVGTSYPVVNKTEKFPDHHACQAAGRQFEESWDRWKTKWTTIQALRLHSRPPTGSALAIGRRAMSVIKLATSREHVATRACNV
jgi:hypothetical protein